jgi:hypothetical protein
MMRAQHFEEMPLNPRFHTEGKGKVGRINKKRQEIKPWKKHV